MTRFGSAFPVAVSLVAVVAVAGAARPRYGDTLRLQTQGTIRSIDPAFPPSAAIDADAARHIQSLVFETLIGVGENGLAAGLARSWELDATRRVWRIQLRPNVMLHDGARLEPAQVADAVRVSQRQWQVSVDGAALVIDPGTGSEVSAVPWTLADPRNAVVIRRANGALVGTGPFRLERLDPMRIALRAHDDYWGSRPFVDAVQVDMGRSLTSQLADFEAGRADMVAIQPTDRRRLVQRGMRVAASHPIELVALIVEPHRTTPAYDAVRRTIATAFDRAAICRVVLQDSAQPAEGLMPAWLSGYPSFARGNSTPRLSRTAVAALPIDQRTLALRVDASDSAARAIAERIAVDLREAGFAMTVQAPTGLAARPDLRLVRVKLEAASPDRTLAGLMSTLGPRILTSVARTPLPTVSASLPDVYRLERALLEHDVIVPVVHVPELYALSDRVDVWNGSPVGANGFWDLASLWVRATTP